jgi:hypothetical protein
MKTKYFLPVAIFAVICLTALGLGLAFNTARLQAAPQASKTENNSSPAAATALPPSDTLRQKMEKAEVHLSALEATLTRIEETRVITPEDNNALDSNGLALGDTLYAAFDEASQSTLDAAESEGRSGNAQDLPYFESFEENHVSRTEAIAARTEQIQRGIDSGEIILKQSPTTLAPSEAKMTKVGYNKSEIKPSLSPAGLAETADFTCGVAGSKTGSSSKVLKPCIAPCIAQNWAECASCIIRSVPAGINYYNQFRNCWNNCGGFWKWACRVKCVAVFVYWIY